MECGHKFCKDCYSEYLNNQVASGPDSINTTCPQSGCKLIVPEYFFEKCCTSENYNRYRYYFKKSFIDINKTTKWCPAPNCTYAVEYPSMKPTDVVCKCGNDWCFKCLKKAHRPIHCDMLVKWMDRINLGNDDTDVWIKLNTKHCPKCKVSI